MKEEKHRLFNELKKVCNKEKEEKEKAEQMNTYLHPNSSYVPYQTQQPGFDSQGRISKCHILGKFSFIKKVQKCVFLIQ